MTFLGLITFRIIISSASRKCWRLQHVMTPFLCIVTRAMVLSLLCRWTYQSGYRMAPKTLLLRRFPRFLAIFGFPLGAQKAPKIVFLLKKPSQGMLFHRFLLRMSFSSIFRLIFSWFWMKNQWKKTCFFQAPLAFFPTWRPSRNTVIYDTKATFLFFEF